VRPDVSVIVPVLEDRGKLAALVEQLMTAARPPRETIIVSGRPHMQLAEQCERLGARYFQTPANRGAQLALGAREARGTVLWFIHADARPHAKALEGIDAAIAAGAESGCFAFRFDGETTWRKRLLGALINARVSCGGIPYGDQGLFATREAYLTSGGFASQPLFEEVELVKRLRKRGTFRRLALEIEVSARRWERDGWWRRSLLNRWLALCYTCGTPAEQLAERYWPGRRESNP